MESVCTLRSRWNSDLQRGGCRVLQCNMTIGAPGLPSTLCLTSACAVMRAERLLEVKNKNRTPLENDSHLHY